MKSIVRKGGRVQFPEFRGERVYMREFKKSQGLPFDLARWQPTVDAMLSGVETDGSIFIMIDEGVLKAGNTHRRPGLHIDGYWLPNISAHGGGGHGGSRHIGCWKTGGWAHADYSEKESIILASTVTASRALVGEFHGMPEEGGDCSHIDVSGLDEITLDRGVCYMGNVTMLHESLIIPFDCQRSLVRLNVQGWEPV